MNGKVISYLMLALAVIAAAIAAVVVSVKRADEARAYARAAESAEAKADAERKAAAKAAEAESDKRKQAEANQKAKSDELAMERLSKEKAALDREAAEENRKAKEAEAAKAKSDAVTAQAKREIALAEAAKARDVAEAENKKSEAAALKAQAEADRLATEKVKSDKIIAEAKLLELRQVDFQSMQQELMEWKRDLDEREAALRPEKTVVDLSWVGGDDDMEVSSNGTVVVKQKVPYLAENDHSLPKGERTLAKANRLVGEMNAQNAGMVRESVVKKLEALYVRALKDDDANGAEYYKKSLKTLYPDWEFKGVAKEEEIKK